jgi:hypothetical protein
MQFIRDYVACAREPPIIRDNQLFDDFLKKIFPDDSPIEKDENPLEIFDCYPRNYLRHFDKVLIVMSLYIAIEKYDFEMIEKITEFIQSI